MNIRKLRNDDAKRMLQWMHDKNVVQYLEKDFESMTLDDCISFIEKAGKDSQSRNYAVIDEQKQYIGTVSLKNIQNGYAEFAITICSEAMGKGYARKAMEEIIAMGFRDIGLHTIYWYVSMDNKRAIRFYDRKYVRYTEKPDFLPVKESINNLHKLYWYYVMNEDSCKKPH